MSLKPLFKCSVILLKNPEKNVMLGILEMPFTRWRKVDEQDALIFNRRTLHLSVSVKKSGQSYKLHFKNTWYVVTFFYKNVSVGNVFLLGVKKTFGTVHNFLTTLVISGQLFYS